MIYLLVYLLLLLAIISSIYLCVGGVVPIPSLLFVACTIGHSIWSSRTAYSNPRAWASGLSMVKIRFMWLLLPSQNTISKRSSGCNTCEQVPALTCGQLKSFTFCMYIVTFTHQSSGASEGDSGNGSLLCRPGAALKRPDCNRGIRVGDQERPPGPGPNP
jgi:hypothetical protein